MSESMIPIAEWCAAVIEMLGILVITGLTIYALIFATVCLVKRDKAETVFQEARLRIGRGILLGLELLIAADIIHTVAVDLTFRTVGVLAAIVLIRTFLSFTLEVELTGNWPWRAKNVNAAQK